MFKDSSKPNRYYACLVGNGFDNKYANVYVKIVRNSINGCITRPIDKYGKAPSKFYRVQIKTGSILPKSLTNSKNHVIGD